MGKAAVRSAFWWMIAGIALAGFRGAAEPEPPPTREVRLAQAPGGTPAPAGRPSPAVEAAVRALVDRYCAAYARRDLDALMALWSDRAPERAAHRQKTQQAFARYASIELKNLRISALTQQGELAMARVTVERG